MPIYHTIAHTDQHGVKRNYRVFATFFKDDKKYAVIARKKGAYDVSEPFEVIACGDNEVMDWELPNEKDESINLISAFIWDYTAEGHEFWSNQYYNKFADTAKGRAAIAAVREQFE